MTGNFGFIMEEEHVIEDGNDWVGSLAGVMVMFDCFHTFHASIGGHRHWSRVWF